MSWTTVTSSCGPAAVVDPNQSPSVLGIHQTSCFLSMASTPVRSVDRSSKLRPASPSVFLRGSTCTVRPLIPRRAWSFPRTAVYTKALTTIDTNAPGGLSTRNSGEKRLKQSTVCALSAVIQSVSTHTTYA